MSTDKKIGVCAIGGGMTAGAVQRVVEALKDRQDIVVHVINDVPHLPIRCAGLADDFQPFNDVPFRTKQSEGRRFDGTLKKRGFNRHGR